MVFAHYFAKKLRISMHCPFFSSLTPTGLVAGLLGILLLKALDFPLWWLWASYSWRIWLLRRYRWAHSFIP